MNDEDAVQRQLDIEDAEREERLHPAPKIGNAQVTASRIAWMLGAFFIDSASSYAIGIVTFWWYGVSWLIAGAGGLVYSDWLRERVGNNSDQRKIADNGIIVSAVAIVIMAGAAGLALVLQITNNPYIEGFMILSVVGLFLFHVLQSYRYYTLDDGVVARNELGLANDAHNRRMEEIKRARIRLENMKIERAEHEKGRDTYGKAWDRVSGNPMTANAAKVDGVKLDDGNPTVPPTK